MKYKLFLFMIALIMNGTCQSWAQTPSLTDLIHEGEALSPSQDSISPQCHALEARYRRPYRSLVNRLNAQVRAATRAMRPYLNDPRVLYILRSRAALSSQAGDATNTNSDSWRQAHPDWVRLNEAVLRVENQLPEDPTRRICPSGFRDSGPFNGRCVRNGFTDRSPDEVVDGYEGRTNHRVYIAPIGAITLSPLSSEIWVSDIPSLDVTDGHGEEAETATIGANLEIQLGSDGTAQLNVANNYDFHEYINHRVGSNPCPARVATPPAPPQQEPAALPVATPTVDPQLENQQPGISNLVGATPDAETPQTPPPAVPAE